MKKYESDIFCLTPGRPQESEKIVILVIILMRFKFLVLLGGKVKNFVGYSLVF